MLSLSTPAIILRRISYGDYDLIITLFTLDKGKISVIAKSAKKSVKRFSGILEPFSVLQVVYGRGRSRGLPVLQEAALKYPFLKNGAGIKKIAYAGYMAELINECMEDGKKQVQLYYLFQQVLERLDLGCMNEEALSILFQMRFMAVSGLSPNLRYCSICQIEMEKIKRDRIVFDIAKGGLVCEECVASPLLRRAYLSKGTVKHLLWVERGSLNRAERIRFTPCALEEGLKFLEAFVPYHLGKEPKSLRFLKQVRSKGSGVRDQGSGIRGQGSGIR